MESFEKYPVSDLLVVFFGLRVTVAIAGVDLEINLVDGVIGEVL